MSWYFDLAGSDKAALAAGVQDEITKAKANHAGHEVVVEKVGDAILAALDQQTRDGEPTNVGFRIMSAGHVDARSADGKFEIRRVVLT